MPLPLEGVCVRLCAFVRACVPACVCVRVHKTGCFIFTLVDFDHTMVNTGNTYRSLACLQDLSQDSEVNLQGHTNLKGETEEEVLCKCQWSALDCLASHQRKTCI